MNTIKYAIPGLKVSDPFTSVPVMLEKKNFIPAVAINFLFISSRLEITLAPLPTFARHAIMSSVSLI